MVVLSASIRCLGSWPQLVQCQPKGCRWRRAPWIQGQRRMGSVVAVGKVCEVLDSKQTMQVSVFVDSLLDWNQRMNLTAVTERDAVMERHIMDSLALLPVLETAYGEHSPRTSVEQLKLIDVGTGPGLPGIVFAIARPAISCWVYPEFDENISVVLEDKDIRIDTYRASGAGGQNVNTTGSADGGQDKNHREVYDVAVARAVAEMRVLSELCLPFVRVGGIFVAAKGPNPQEEVESAKKAISLLGASLLSVSNVASTGPLGQRTAIVCHKRKSTPAKYPRRPGTPKITPL